MRTPDDRTLEIWRQEALAQGWTLLGRVDGRYASYRHDCGHEQEAKAAHMRTGSVRCQGCASPLLRWRTEAEARGWTLLTQIDGNSGQYQHACGHEQRVLAANMRKGSVRCHGCRGTLQRWKAEAKERGWALLEKFDGEIARYRHACGHRQITSAHQMRAGTVRCARCGRPSRQAP